MPFIVISGFSMSLYVGSVTNDLIKFLAHFRQYTCVCPDVGDVPVHLNHDVSDIDNFIQLHCSISGDLQNVIPNIGDFSLNIRESSVEFAPVSCDMAWNPRADAFCASAESSP